MQWLRRLFRRDRLSIPDALWRDSINRLAFLDRLPARDLSRLKAAAETLLATKAMTGAGGLALTDRIAVLIAVQACLPVLNLTLDLYRDMAGIIVYPSAFIVPRNEMDEAGVIHEWREPLAGEALAAGGAVVLSWQDVEEEQSFAAGHNVVIHEFAHKIDMGRGNANGFPPFLADYHHTLRAADWQQAFSAAYADFTARVEALDRQADDDAGSGSVTAAAHGAAVAPLPMDPYAAQHPAEFFAVASEMFFVMPQPLASNYPHVYRLLARYYRQDPLAQA